MPARKKHEEIRCEYFLWKLYLRKGAYYADGRTNTINLGRNSLGTPDRDEALSRLRQLDRISAIRAGLRKQDASQKPSAEERRVTLAEGRKDYEEYLRRPAVVGGVRETTFKRYRTVLDKFMAFCEGQHIATWNQVDAKVLERYAGYLEAKDYKRKTITNELTTLKQAFRFLVNDGKLPGKEPIQLRVVRADSRPAYCWKPEEVPAMIEYTRDIPDLRWLHDVIVILSATGLRIAELASLRWTDLDLEAGRLTLTDETGTVKSGNQARTLKSGRSRSMPLFSKLIDHLKLMPKRGKYVLYGPRGGKLKPDTVGRRFKQDVVYPLSERFPSDDEGEGFSSGTCHSFRHFFISTCANHGVSLMAVMDWVGHSDSAMVRGYYHLHDAEARRQIENLPLL